ncbi:tRNA dimethylallyltransferase-like [Saccostrea echinata]|uniref:tRNA dimethylallyltransferase-like n=1 Tax=Saccostrea echinata TaxID=191078 RepID=UPI002A809A70|nr:tRNA dimethylallyltransferase-like [Saccostrea echinata]
MAASMIVPSLRVPVPVVFVLGATGTGKSKLAIEIGRKFNGEIISTDSMQVYQGLDIVTNKVTTEEQDLCPHHMINYVSPLEEDYHIHRFRSKALPIIEQLLKDKKLPIIVGGTNYYIESLLWNTLIKSEDIERAKLSSEPSVCEKQGKNGDIEASREEEVDKYGQVITEESHRLRSEKDGVYGGLDTCTLYQSLQTVDPLSASRIHPNDRRKMLRALEAYDVHGVPMSEIYKAQKSADSKLRYPNTCVLWVQSEQSVLDDRTNKRVDTMIERGLIQELLDFHQQYNAKRERENREIDYTTGIFQSIGFKEFHEYLLLPEEERNSDKGKLMFEKGVDKMKIATRQYARRQIHWIKSRLFRNKGSNPPPVYAVDSTDVNQWKGKVHDPAIQIVQDYVNGVVPTQEPLPLTEYDDEKEFNHCKICNKTFVMKKKWLDHLKSSKHYRRKKSIRKRLGETSAILDKVIEMRNAKRTMNMEDILESLNSLSDSSDVETQDKEDGAGVEGT